MRRTYPEGVTCWVDLEADDVDEAAGFYGALFGWTFIEAGGERRYLIAQRQGQDAAGIAQRLDVPGMSGADWNTYISVRDMPQALDRVVDAGGRITETRRVSGRPPSLHRVSTRRESPSACGRLATARAHRWPTLLVPGTSVTCTPRTRQQRWASTAASSAGSSTMSGSRR